MFLLFPIFFNLFAHRFVLFREILSDYVFTGRILHERCGPGVSLHKLPIAIPRRCGASGQSMCKASLRSEANLEPLPEST